MIEFKALTKTYDGVKNALDDLTLQIPDGCIFGLLGPNGAGKTTTLKLLTGLLEASSGEVLVNGLSYPQDAIEIKKNLAFVPDDPNVFLRLKGIEYLNFIADMYDVPAEGRRARIDELAKRFDMLENLGKRISDYSHGMRQKIVLIAALLHRPKLWILDEPLTGLDPASAYTLKQMMREHADKGYTVLFSTHVLEVAEKLVDRLAIIAGGKLRFEGTISDLQAQVGGQNESLEELFLSLTGEKELLDRAVDGGFEA